MKKTHDEYVNEVKMKNPTIEVIEKYSGANVRILHKCLVDSHMWKATPHNILSGSGCPLCGGNIKKTTEQYIEELYKVNPNVEVIEKYINATTPINHKCKIDGYIWKATPSSVLCGNGCARCAGNSKKTTNSYIQELSKVNKHVIVLGEYVNAAIPILHKCTLDDYEWMVYPSNALKGEGCPKCKNRLLAEKFSKSHAQYICDVAKLNPDIEVLGIYQNAHTPILHKCKIDGCEWFAQPSNILSKKGCPHCQESQGEKQIEQWLKNHQIEYHYQYLFDECKDKRALPFDFYLLQYHACIEYDGIQHFKPIDFAGKGEKWAQERFEVTQRHDKIKTEYCHDNNISLLRISCYQNIEEELDKFFIHLI